MAIGREVCVLELDGPRLTAIGAVLSVGRIEVTRWRTAERPASIEEDNAAAVGEWVGKELRDAGLPRGWAIIAVPRSGVVLKALALPGGDGTTAELVGMVRLQMVKQLTMAAEGIVIDYAVGAATETGGRQVMAGAMPGERVAWYRTMAESAGLNLRRIGLRSFGAAALLAELSQRRSGALLGVAVGGSTTELLVLEDGRLTQARAVDSARPAAEADAEAFAERLSVEAKRTWMSHRATPGSADLETVAVLGQGELSDAVALRCGSELECSGITVGPPASAAMPPGMREAERGLALPLLGLLVEEVLEQRSLDFANPRRAPDRSAQRRQMALAGVAGLIVLGGAGYVAGDHSLGGLRTELKALQTKEAELRTDVEAFQADHARVAHLESWRTGGVDWLAHIRRVSDRMPDPRVATLDELSGRLSVTPAYAGKSGKPEYPGGVWSVRREAVFEVAGKSKGRQVAADLREALLEGEVYGVKNRGPDVAERFSLELRTGQPTPRDAAPPVKPVKGATP